METFWIFEWVINIFAISYHLANFHWRVLILAGYMGEVTASKIENIVITNDYVV